MKLHEYQSKQIFDRYGIPIPRGRVASSADEARAIAEELGGRTVIKSQVLIGGRGKAGGIRLAASPEDAERLARDVLGMTIKELHVRKILVDEAAEIAQEIYLGVTNDRAQGCPVVIASAEGGVEIEEIARTDPEKIVRVPVDPLLGLRDYQARDLASDIELQRSQWRAFNQIAKGLYRAYVETDSSLAEINPLVITEDDRMLALDGKMVIDDNGLFRHPELAEMRDMDEEPPVEREARSFGLSYVKLEGNVGCMVNGAGLAMTTLDVIEFFGGAPANFLDIGGGADSEKVAAALRIILKDPSVETILINIFGGITRCDEVARGILEALESQPTETPMVVRLVGTNEEDGRMILSEADMITATSLSEAAKQAVAAAKGAQT